MKYCDYVNINQGSESTHRFSNGNTLPLVQLPFGMAAFAPQTAENDLRWYYHPKHRSLEGIRLTHQPSPWIADYGAMCFMLQNDEPQNGGEERYSGFRPEDAVLKPFYLRYNLLRSYSVFELAPAERCAAVKATFNKEGSNYFSVHSVSGNYSFSFKDNTLYCETDNCSGGDHVNFKEYAVIKFSCDINASQIIVSDGNGNRNANEISGKDVSIHIPLNEGVTDIRIGTSYISYAQAVISLERETSGKSFDDIRDEAEALWESYLGRISIEPQSEKQYKTFLSCMYRAFLYPHKCSEINEAGEEIHYCPYDGRIYPGVRYTDNGFWDTYRTVYPFFSLVARDEMKLMMNSYIGDYREGGWLPRWTSMGERGCMPSTLLDAVICDAAVKGLIDKEDLETALEGMIKHSVEDAPESRFGRNGAGSYCKLGYVPYEEERESVNLTQDAAYGDWCIAEIAKLLGKPDIEAEYRIRSKNYKNIFDPETGFMRAKNRSGEFRPDFVPEGWGRDYTEGSAWQNSFAVPHDIEGLAELYGGKDKLEAKIDELFATPPVYKIVGYDCEIHEITEMASADFGQCAISNQPSFHIPYIYSALGNTEKTAYWVKRLCEEAFSFADDGFPGDEDNGTTAIWYIFGILGFYPFCPGKKEFVKGIKQVKKAYIGEKEIDTDKINGNIIKYEEIV